MYSVTGAETNTKESTSILTITNLNEFGNSPKSILRNSQNMLAVLRLIFSLYLDMPKAMMIWNAYRSRMIGQVMQRYGIEVIPTLSWGYEDTFEFCFEGLPKNSIVSISTVGVSNDDESLRVRKAGVDESIKRLKPKAIILYGNMIEHDFEGGSSSH